MVRGIPTFIVRYHFADDRPFPHGGRWLGVRLEETDAINAIITSRRNNRELGPFADRALKLLDVCVEV